MTVHTLETIIYVAVVLFLPLLPAYILYKFLPSKTIVTGPFKGFQIALSGAFAGYFLLVMIASGVTYFRLTPPPSIFEVWKVSGKVSYAYEDPHTGREKRDAIGIEIGIFPPEYQVGSKGNFIMNILVKPGHIPGLRLFPTLFFHHPRHKEISRNLNSLIVRINEQEKEIFLTEEITLEKLPEPVRQFQLLR